MCVRTKIQLAIRTGETIDGTNAWDSVRVNENTKNRELASKGVKLPATACSARGQLFCAVSRFAAGERLRHCCGHGFVVHSIRLRARRRSAAAFFPWRASNRLAAGAYSFHRVAGRSNGQLELCVLELVDQLGHNKYFDAAR